MSGGGFGIRRFFGRFPALCTTHSPPPTPPQGPLTAASRAVLHAPRPLPSDEPAVLGLRAHRVDLTRRRNNRSPEREE